MRSSVPRSLLIFLLLPVLAFVALGAQNCDGGASGKAGKNPNCALDANALSGIWVAVKSGPTGDVADKFSSAKFFTEDGRKKVAFTGGILIPGNPATKKYLYDFVKVTPEGGAVFAMNMMTNKTPERIERLKKDNRRPELFFERRLTAAVDEKLCALNLKDEYVSYIKGVEKTEPTNHGEKDYREVKEQLGFVDCNEPQQLLVFKEETLDLEKSEPLNVREGVFAKEPVWFHYIEKQFQGTPEEVRAQLTKVGAVAEPGCNYDYDFWLRDLAAPGGEKVEVKPGQDGFLNWRHQYTFDASSADGVFVEMHRYKTCADGKRSLLGATCVAVWPEPEKDAAGGGAAPSGEASAGTGSASGG